MNEHVIESTLPPAALARLQTAYRTAELARMQYDALSAMAIEALGYDPTSQGVHLDLATGAVTIETEGVDERREAGTPSVATIEQFGLPPGWHLVKDS